MKTLPCLLALFAVVTTPVLAEPIEPGQTITRTLEGRQTHRYELDALGGVRITAEGIERGVMTTVFDEAGTRLQRTGSWRGAEGRHSAVVTLTGPATIEISPDEVVWPDGTYRLTVEYFDATQPEYEAWLAMARGADRHLQHHFGEPCPPGHPPDPACHRTKARAFFLDAAARFATLEDRTAQADAMFEAASVSETLQLPLQALDEFTAAEGLYRQLGDDAGVAAALNMQGNLYRLASGVPGHHALAIDRFESAAIIRASRGDRHFEAQTINNRGLVHRELNDALLALEYFTLALQRWQGGVDLTGSDIPSCAELDSAMPRPYLKHAITAMNNQGWALEYLADYPLAVQRRTLALALTGCLRDELPAAMLEHNLGILLYKLGDLDAALVHYTKALNFFLSTATDELWAGSTHHRFAEVYQAAGEYQRALDAIEEALALRTPVRDPAGRAASLLLKAQLLLETDAAASLTALQSIGTVDDNASIAAAMHELAARSYLAQGALAEARDHSDRAVKSFQNLRQRRDVPRVRTLRARVNLAAGRDTAALLELRRALTETAEINDEFGRLGVLVELSRVHLHAKEYAQAQRVAGEAVSVSDALRASIGHPLLRRNFAAVQYDAYDVLVAAWLGLGQFEEALLVAEAARAPRFNELLNAGRDASLTAQELDKIVALRRRLETGAERRTRLLELGEKDAAEQVRLDLAPWLDQLVSLQSRTEAVAGPSPVEALAQVRSTLRPDEVILYYHLGQATAGAWAIRASSIAYRAIDDTAGLRRDLERLLASVRRDEFPDSVLLQRLSRTLLGPPDALAATDTHVVVVPDGPLHYLPFALLPDPRGGNNDPMIERHRLSVLTSLRTASTLTSRRAVPVATIAVMADPVFDGNDPRIGAPAPPGRGQAQASLGPQAAASLNRSGVDLLRRLPGTADEAKAIVRAADQLPVSTFLGTRATRFAVLSGALDPYDIVHFATHGFLDDTEPALSGLVLAGLNDLGVPQSQFLRATDIVSLDLAARLVVLSGCETGTGQLVTGEGVASLTRAFLYAGADQVIATLWRVPDAASAALMAQFYTQLLQHGQPAAEALRLAQNHVRSRPRWSKPRYWAGFVLDGRIH